MFRLSLTTSAAVLALGLAACGDGDDDIEDVPAAQDEGMDADVEDPAMDDGAAEQGGVDGEMNGAAQNRQANAGTSGQGESMRASGSQPSPEVMSIVEEARDCQSEQTDMEFTPEEQDEGEDEAAYNAEVSESYLTQNRERECVFELPSGLQFTIQNAVMDGPSPNSGELVRVNYEGRLVSGDTFDSSYDRGQPAVFPSDRLISGWVEALPLMRVDEEWTLFVPPELGYGQRGTPGGPIGPNQALIFRIELLGLPGREQGQEPGQEPGMSGQENMQDQDMQDDDMSDEGMTEDGGMEPNDG